MLFSKWILNNSLWPFAATHSQAHDSWFHNNSLNCTYQLTFTVTHRQDGVNLTIKKICRAVLRDQILLLCNLREHGQMTKDISRDIR